MPKFRKKPVVIEAIQFDGTDESIASIRALSDYIVSAKGQERDGSPFLIIETLEGDMKCSLMDYVIKGVKGEIYPCKPDIFSATYEAD